MDKFKSIFYKAILVILFVFTLYVTYCSIFKIYEPAEELKPIIIMIGTIVAIFAFAGIKRLLNKVPEKKANLVAGIICIIFFIGLCIVGNVVKAAPVFDLSNIQAEIKVMLSNGGNFENIGYFAKYTNQIPLTILIYGITKIGQLLHIKDLEVFMIFVNCICIAVTAFFTYLSAKKLKDYKIGLLSLLFFVINPVFYLYASYYYTDTMSMPFAAIGFYLFVLAINNKKQRKSLLTMLFSGIIFAIGFKIRVVVAILLIGAVIGIIINNKFSKDLLIKFIALFIGIIIGWGSFWITCKSMNVPQQKNKEFPPTHWIMMGLNEKSKGEFSSNDHNNTKNQNSYAKKVKYNLNIIGQRIEAFGLSNLLEFEKNKIAVNWSNGDYYYIESLGNVKNDNILYEYTIGNKKIFLLYYMQILKTTLMLILLICVIKELQKKDNSNINCVYIAIFGAFIFYLLWEVKSRYCFSFLPWIIMTFGIGITHVENVIYSEKKNLSKIIAIATLSISVFLLIINSYNYAVKQNNYYDTIISQTERAGKGFEYIAQNTVAQTFSIDKNFDSIELKFKKDKVNTKTDYKFYLKDINGNILFEKEFSSSDVKKGYNKFEFEEIKPSNKTEYVIEVKSDNATEDNTLGLEMFYRKNNDSYSDGIMKVSDKEQESSDLVFKVENKENKNYVSKIFYISISLLIILIEIFAFCPVIKNKEREK